MADTGSVAYRVEQFHIKHGGKFIIEDNYCRYPDGSYRDVNPMGILAEPPLDGKKRRANITKYYLLKARRLRPNNRRQQKQKSIMMLEFSFPLPIKITETRQRITK